MFSARALILAAVSLSGGVAFAQSSVQSPARPSQRAPVQPLAASAGAETAAILPTPAVGAPVWGAGGEVLGRIEAVVTEGGRPVQVVVRTRGRAEVRARSRAVPVSSLRPDGAGWILPLRRAEFDLLPPVGR